MDICLLWVLSVVRWRSLRRAGHSSRGVLPTVVRRCVWSRKPINNEALAHWPPHWGLLRLIKKNHIAWKFFQLFCICYLRTQIVGPTDGPFEQAIRWDGNTRELPLAVAHATNLAAPLGYRPQCRNKTNTPHITVARGRVHDTITFTVLFVALAFFTQQFICGDIFNLRHSMLSQWWRWHHLTVCDAVYCGGNLPTFQVLCIVGKFQSQYTASHSKRLETSATPQQNFQFCTTILTAQH